MTGEELLIELHRRGIKQKELAHKLGLTHTDGELLHPRPSDDYPRAGDPDMAGA
jgi:hypothetical protein